jgi:hypothetical protein
MQHKKHAIFTLTAVIIVVCSVATSAFISNSPAQMQIAKGANLVWEQPFGGNGDDRAFNIANAENGYFVVGSSTSFIAGKTVAWLLRLDQNGNQLWNRTFSEYFGSEFRCIRNVPDGFLVVGNVFLDSGKVDGLVMKLDLQGNPVWNVTLKENALGVNKLFSGASDGDNFLVAGLTQPQGNTTSNAWLVKLDTAGNILWSGTFGGSSETAFRAVTIVEGNCYVAAGYLDALGNGNYDYLLFNLDVAGNVLWHKTFGGSESDKAYAIASTFDGCVVVGDTRSKGSGECDAWVIKVDFDGNLVWDQTAGGSGFDSPAKILADPSGGFLVVGTTFSFGNGQRDFWLFKISSEGNVVFSSTVGRSDYEEAYGVTCAGGNDYVLAGWTNSVGNGGRYDFYVVKISV